MPHLPHSGDSGHTPHTSYEDRDLIPVGTRGHLLFLLMLITGCIPCIVGFITILRWIWSLAL